jgi:hypothetical protein
MKYISLSILMMLCSISYSKTIVVHNKKDVRLKLYLDSLSNWNARQEINKKHKKLLDDCRYYDEYLYTFKVLGYSPCNNNTSSDGKLMYNDSRTYFSHELLTCFHSQAGDHSCIYVPIVKKPKIKVVYKPLQKKVYVSNINTIYNKRIKLHTKISMYVKTDDNYNMLIEDMKIIKFSRNDKQTI